jgi:ribosomal protein S27AE
MSNAYCPGSAGLNGTPTLTIKTCPQCGADVELFSIDLKMACDRCGFVVYNNVQSCIQWCRFAEACVGAEMYAQYKRKPAEGSERAKS